MSEINSFFPILFQEGGSPAREEGQKAEGGVAGKDSDDGEGFVEKWGWFYNVDIVSGVIRSSWDEVFMKPAVEFLNLVCYCKDKDTHEKKRLEDWKRKN